MLALLLIGRNEPSYRGDTRVDPFLFHLLSLKSSRYRIYQNVGRARLCKADRDTKPHSFERDLSLDPKEQMDLRGLLNKRLVSCPSSSTSLVARISATLNRTTLEALNQLAEN